MPRTPSSPLLSPGVAVDVRMWRHSGIGSYLRGLLSELALLPSSPRLICLASDDISRKPAGLHPDWRTERFDASVYSLLEQLRHPPFASDWALYHAPHYNFPLQWPADRPLVVTIHDLIHLQSPNPLKRRYLAFFLNQLQKRDPSRLRIIVGSHATREHLLQAAPAISEEQIRLVPYGISAQYLAPRPDPETIRRWRASRGLPADYLLMVGVALPHKNHEFVLRSLLPLYERKKLDLPIVVCGIGEQGVRRYRRIASEIAPNAPLTLLSHVAQAEMPLLYAAAAALVFPSLIEGYGLPIVEAQAVGTPVLASDRPAPREAGGDAALYFDPTNSESLIEALHELLSGSESTAALVQQGRARAAAMTWQQTAAQTADVYRELAGETVFPDFSSPPASSLQSPDFSSPPASSLQPPASPRIPFASRRIAFVHDWLNGKRGGERVLEDLSDIWPLADIHTLFYEPHRVSTKINRHCIVPSILQHIPRTRRHYRNLLPLFPSAMRKMKLDGYDAIISISHCAAKAAPAPPGVPHICYCLTPARYFYDQAEAYFGDSRNPITELKRLIIRRLTQWDQETAANVTHFVAISQFVADRIRRIYRREADIVYPAVDTDFFTPPSATDHAREDFYIIVCTAVPYKRVDVAVEAFNQLGHPLLVVGRGPGLAALQKMARPNVTFRPWVGQRELRDLYRRAKGFVFVAEEDFGIAPVEAQACGCPVIAFGRGGASETVIHGETGLLFPEQSVESLTEALRRFSPADFSPQAIRANAERFNPARFRDEFIEILRRFA